MLCCHLYANTQENNVCKCGSSGKVGAQARFSHCPYCGWLLPHAVGLGSLSAAACCTAVNRETGQTALRSITRGFLTLPALLSFKLECAMEGKQSCNSYLQSQEVSKNKAADVGYSRAVSDVLAEASENLARAKPVGRWGPEPVLFRVEAREQRRKGPGPQRWCPL